MITVQEVLREFYMAYKEQYTPSPEQAKVIHDILTCRTQAKGGRKLECDKCGHSTIVYNSCRNRHCPVCQGVTRAIWVDKKNKDVIDAPYFHLVLTMPEELREIIYQNQRQLYNLMYKVSAETIKELALDEKYLGAQVGFFSLLHTWSQNMHYHPHIHTVVLAGGLTKLNNWRTSSKEFFIPVQVLSSKFRGKYLFFLKKYYHQGKLEFFGDMLKYQNSATFQKLIDQCYKIEWYSYIQETFSGPRAVIRYLGRYTHQVAISNKRILSINDGNVTFSVRRKENSDNPGTVTLRGVEFVRRYLMHILPKGFVKARNYGVMANINKKTKLELCRKLTNSPTIKLRFEGLSNFEVACILADKDLNLCPVCQVGTMNVIDYITKEADP